jgi:hypothetical protein
MAKCSDTIIQNIATTDCLRNSLAKINNNFSELDEIVCTLRQRVDTNRQIRTFFYYGPNAEVAPGSGMDPYRLTRPSNLTIEAFVNSPTQLNLPSFSRPGDIAYVVYQKTGFQGSLPTQSSGFNTETGSAEIYSIGTPTTLLFNKWYNTDNYHSVVASTDGEAPDRLGTITLKFQDTATFNQTESNTFQKQYQHTASGSLGGGQDTFMEWNPDSVIWSESSPIVKTIKGRAPRPYKNVKGSQFIFLNSGNFISSSLTGFYKKTALTPGVSPATVTSDIVVKIEPVFIIWRLNYIETQYITELGFPKFNKGSTSTNGAANINWNQPQNWTTYESWT